MNWKYTNNEEEAEAGSAGADLAAMLMAASAPTASYEVVTPLEQ